jgi:hypothetical protein
MSSQTVSLKTSNRATLEGVNCCIGKEAANESHIPKDPFYLFRHGLDIDSTGFQHFFAFSCESLSFFDFIRLRLKNRLFTYHDCLFISQTESKGNFHSMTLYSHKTLFQPQAIRAKKQTFSNSDCCQSCRRQRCYSCGLKPPHCRWK